MLFSETFQLNCNQSSEENSFNIKLVYRSFFSNSIKEVIKCKTEADDNIVLSFYIYISILVVHISTNMKGLFNCSALYIRMEQ